MKRTIIAAATAIALVMGLVSAATATTVSFPPDISMPDKDGTSSTSKGAGTTDKR
ncbi:hypothetical protein [Tateyamaria sp. syn59]|uniref:hypothetical protein n=1 Tax=Tateyamaria sp. syn59 TaxID=2576942 RepID=UPI001674F2EA|nr:hypothetical protein [Tateyamaria sp. syn59]